MVSRISIQHAWQGGADCLNCSVRHSALFSGLTEDDFRHMHQPVEQVELKAGQVLYKINQPGRYLFTVRGGLMKLVQYLPDGNQRIVRLACGADVLGLETLVSQQYEHDAVALRDTFICRLPVEDVHRLSQRNPILHRDLMARWQRALSEADAWLTQLSTGASKKRMAHLLLRLGEGEAKQYCTLFGREDIGSILSITTETASRVLSDFKRQGLITERRHNHFLLDREGLQKVAQE